MFRGLNNEINALTSFIDKRAATNAQAQEPGSLMVHGARSRISRGRSSAHADLLEWGIHVNGMYAIRFMYTNDNRRRKGVAYITFRTHEHADGYLEGCALHAAFHDFV